VRDVLGPDGEDDAPRRGERVPGRRPPDRVGRHDPADAARRPAADQRRRRPAHRGGARAPARRRRLPGLPPRRPGAPQRVPVARFLLYERTYPNSVAASIDSLHEALHDADADPRNSDPVLRVRRLGADLEFRSHAERGGDLHETCQDIQEELQRVDRDIATAYFAGASGTMAVT